MRPLTAPNNGRATRGRTPDAPRTTVRGNGRPWREARDTRKGIATGLITAALLLTGNLPPSVAMAGSNDSWHLVIDEDATERFMIGVGVALTLPAGIALAGNSGDIAQRVTPDPAWTAFGYISGPFAVLGGASLIAFGASYDRPASYSVGAVALATGIADIAIAVVSTVRLRHPPRVALSPTLSTGRGLMPGLALSATF